MRIVTLKTRSEFQRVRGGGRCSLAAFVLEGKARPEDQTGRPRFGFTVTKKLGGAVQRNRIRRRLKAAVSELASELADPGFDYVIVAREPALSGQFAELRSDLAKAFRSVHDKARNQSGSSSKAAKRTSAAAGQLK